MNYSVDYTYLHRGTIHVDAKSKKEATAIVKEMWDIDVDRVYINADEEYVDENTFKVVDVQPDPKKKYRVTVQETKTYEDDVYAADYYEATSKAKQLDPDKNCTVVRQVFAESEDEEEEEE